jgi:hypothetical protein
VIERTLYRSVWEELSAEKAMVFIAGPRQVGKTTFAESIARSFRNHAFINWDVLGDRARILKDPYFFAALPRRDRSLAFTIKPWTPRVARAIHKERKLYLFDPALIDDPGARFENLVAIELLRAVQLWNDLGNGRFALHYVKNKEKEEVDFLIADGQRPLLLVETKLGDSQVAPALKKFQHQLGVPAVQLLDQGGEFRRVPNGDHRILVAPAWSWLPRLP